MSPASHRITGVAGAVAVTAALAAGVAVGRRAAGRALDRLPDEPTVPRDDGMGRAATVRTDDGLVLDAEIDEPDRAGEGPDAKPTVVLIHGYALSRDCWHFQRMELRRRYRVVSYDQRGHGHSERAPAGQCTVAACGQDLGCVLDQLVPHGPIVLVGHSMGGMSILSLAAQRPDLIRERVTGVALLATSAGDLGDFAFGLEGAAAGVVGRGTPALVRTLVRAPKVLDGVRGSEADLPLLVTRAFNFGGPTPRARVRFVARLLAATPLEVMADFYPTFAAFDGSDGVAVLAELTAPPPGAGRPLLVLGAAQDRITPVAHARALAARLPAADYTELDPCGHMVMVEQPRQVNRALTALIERSGRLAS